MKLHRRALIILYFCAVLALLGYIIFWRIRYQYFVVDEFLYAHLSWLLIAETATWESILSEPVQGIISLIYAPIISLVDARPSRLYWLRTMNLTFIVFFMVFLHRLSQRSIRKTCLIHLGLILPIMLFASNLGELVFEIRRDFIAYVVLLYATLPYYRQGAPVHQSKQFAAGAAIGITAFCGILLTPKIALSGFPLCLAIVYQLFNPKTRAQSFSAISTFLGLCLGLLLLALSSDVFHAYFLDLIEAVRLHEIYYPERELLANLKRLRPSDVGVLSIGPICWYYLYSTRQASRAFLTLQALFFVFGWLTILSQAATFNYGFIPLYLNALINLDHIFSKNHNPSLPLPLKMFISGLVVINIAGFFVFPDDSPSNRKQMRLLREIEHRTELDDVGCGVSSKFVFRHRAHRWAFIDRARLNYGYDNYLSELERAFENGDIDFCVLQKRGKENRFLELETLVKKHMKCNKLGFCAKKSKKKPGKKSGKTKKHKKDKKPKDTQQSH